MNLEETFKLFRSSYLESTSKNGVPKELAEKNINTLFRLAKGELVNPYPFEAFHEKITAPFDYYRFGIDFFKPLVNMSESTVHGKEVLEEIISSLKKGENAILLANHQTEPDPQVVSILLEEQYPEFAENIIFVAGHRVITDPVAIPFSKGRNLLCIYSKRYIEEPPEKKEEKTTHNRRVLDKLKKLLEEGGKCVYVAPSGGRDRKESDGSVPIAPFDPSSIELFRLIAKNTPTHFYPFAMNTYELMPPPNAVQSVLGERRETNFVPVHIAFGKEIDMDNFPGAPEEKHERREKRALYIQSQVSKEYEKIYKI